MGLFQVPRHDQWPAPTHPIWPALHAWRPWKHESISPEKSGQYVQLSHILMYWIPEIKSIYDIYIYIYIYIWNNIICPWVTKCPNVSFCVSECFIIIIACTQYPDALFDINALSRCIILISYIVKSPYGYPSSTSIICNTSLSKRSHAYSNWCCQPSPVGCLS